MFAAMWCLAMINFAANKQTKPEFICETELESEILQLSKKDKTYVLETVNTIYELEEVDGDELLSND